MALHHLQYFCKMPPSNNAGARAGGTQALRCDANRPSGLRAIVVESLSSLCLRITLLVERSLSHSGRGTALAGKRPTGRRLKAVPW